MLAQLARTLGWPTYEVDSCMLSHLFDFIDTYPRLRPFGTATIDASQPTSNELAFVYSREKQLDLVEEAERRDAIVRELDKADI